VRLTHNDDSRIALVRDSLRMALDLWRVRQRLNAGLYRTVTGEGDARPCPLCGDVDHTPRVAGHGYRMVACASCGLWYLNPMPTAAALARLYEESYFTSAVATTTGYADYAGMADDARDTFRRRLALVDRHVGSGRILDVGAGYGYLAEVAATRFPERWVVERSASAAAHVPPPARVVVGTWEQAEIPERYFDVVSMQDCLEHFPDPLAALAKTRAALRPGGALLAVQPVGQVQLLDVHRAGPVPARHRRVERQASVHAAARPGQAQVGLEQVHRSLERRVEGAFDGDVGEAAQDPGPFLEGEARRPHAQVERGRPRAVVDAAVEREGGSRCRDRERLEKPAARAAAERAAQRIDGQVGRVADE
jgi:SAM-dependent methyltransferase